MTSTLHQMTATLHFALTGSINLPADAFAHGAAIAEIKRHLDAAGQGLEALGARCAIEAAPVLPLAPRAAPE